MGVSSCKSLEEPRESRAEGVPEQLYVFREGRRVRNKPLWRCGKSVGKVELVDNEVSKSQTYRSASRAIELLGGSSDVVLLVSPAGGAIV